MKKSSIVIVLLFIVVALSLTMNPTDAQTTSDQNGRFVIRVGVDGARAWVMDSQTGATNGFVASGTSFIQSGYVFVEPTP